MSDSVETPGPYAAGATVVFPGNVYTRFRPYAANIDQATADRLNRDWQARQESSTESA